MSTLRPRRIAAALAAALLVGLAGCGDSEPESTEAGSAGPGGSGGGGNGDDGPVTVTDSRGEQTLDAPATDVVALEWAYVEDLVAVDVAPIGVADTEGYETWVSSAPLPDSVTDVGLRQEPSIDQIANLAPDLIIVSEDNAQANLDQLEEIADVLVFTGTDTDDNYAHMREEFTQVATAVGAQDQAQTVLDDLDRTIDEARETLADAGVVDDRFAIAQGWTASGSVVVRMFGQGSLAADLTEQVGLVNAWEEEGDAWGLSETDVEGLTDIGDAHFIYVAPDENVFADDLVDNGIWQGLEFVQNDTVHEIDGGTWFFGGPLSSQQYLDELVTTLT